MSKKILFLTLQTFSATGGIQKMNRTLAYTLYQLSEKNQWNINVYASHDQREDLLPQYLPMANFKAFNRNKLKYIWYSLKAGMNADLVILSHVHLSSLGCLLRLLNPKCKIWLIAHGTEVWRPLKLWQKAIWKIADQMICVSSFTKRKIVEMHGAAPDQCPILNNPLDPFIRLPEVFTKPEYLLNRYHLNTNDKVILTLSRIASTEKYKGYEQTIKAVSSVKQRLPNVKYILAGPYDEAEKIRILQLVKDQHLENNFILTGYIKETELADHFLIADLFVMPSKKEGFGIVFIEAMAFGLPVICGNVDGSTDAVRNDEMGTAIDPDDSKLLEQEISQKLARILTIAERKNIQHQCLKYFNAQDYGNNLEKLINNGAAT
jgi:phosphatidylinositol alpha-1,6-mannosyltransferase